MTQEQKELLLKDLTARLRYGVKILHETWNYEWDQEMSLLERVVGIDEKFVYVKVIDTHNGEEYRDDKIPISTFDDKIFLRPMSSMTEEEIKEFRAFHCVDEWHPEFYQAMCNLPNIDNMINWLDKKKFDHRGLIPMNLALEAPEDMYN